MKLFILKSIGIWKKNILFLFTISAYDDNNNKKNKIKRYKKKLKKSFRATSSCETSRNRRVDSHYPARFQDC